MTSTLKDTAYRTIKERIISCQYMPNTFLNEADLIADLDASRTPIREALNKLEQEGFVQILPKKGVMVTGLTLAEINQTFEARILLEPFIVRNYMDRINIEEMQRILEASEHLLESAPKPEEYCILDDRFHRELAKACPNRFFGEMLEHIYDQNQRIRIFSGHDLWDRHPAAAQEHIDLIHFMLNGQQEEATAAIRLHLLNSKNAAVGTMLGHSFNAV